MPNSGYQPIVGSGEYEFASPQVVDEVLIKIDDFGSAHEFFGGVQTRVQHAGYVGIYYINDDDDLHDVVWWKFIDFANQDVPIVGQTFTVHGMFWELADGVEGRLLAHWA